MWVRKLGTPQDIFNKTRKGIQVFREDYQTLYGLKIVREDSNIAETIKWLLSQQKVKNVIIDEMRRMPSG